MDAQLSFKKFALDILRRRERDDAGVFAFADAPDVQGTQCRLERTGIDDVPNLLHHGRVHFCIQQYPT